MLTPQKIKDHPRLYIQPYLKLQMMSNQFMNYNIKSLMLMLMQDSQFT